MNNMVEFNVWDTIKDRKKLSLESKDKDITLCDYIDKGNIIFDITDIVYYSFPEYYFLY